MFMNICNTNILGHLARSSQTDPKGAKGPRTVLLKGVQNATSPPAAMAMERGGEWTEGSGF